MWPMRLYTQEHEKMDGYVGRVRNEILSVTWELLVTKRMVARELELLCEVPEKGRG